MLFPDYRPRRMRHKDYFRKMIRETVLSVNDLVLPLFVVFGKNIRKPIEAMPGQYQLSIDRLVLVAKQAYKLGIPAVLLFGIPIVKDSYATNAYDDNGIVQTAIKALKDNIPDLCIITDVCLCQYTDHGHCGIIKNGIIDNDITLDLIAKIALSYAKSGADMIAPSDMMDGRIIKIRRLLDQNSLYHVSIMSYSVKYCSQYYGPFRQAADSSPVFGDRRSYQMDPSNSRESIRESLMDISEGADIIMVKPALSYLDIIYQIKRKLNIPIAAYNVSGEYSMIKAADSMGWINGKEVMMETLLSIKRAGADIIITYFAIEAAEVLNT